MILITGYKGFIGSKLSKKLDNFIGIDLKDGLDLLTCPLPNNIDLVYHLASQTSVESSWQDPIHDLKSIQLTARLVKEYPNTKIIYVNSCAAIDPKTPYGFSKKMSFEYLKTFHDSWVSCVLPNVYGGGNGVIDLFKDKDEVTIYGDGLAVRDYVHVDDIIEGLLLAKEWDCGEYYMGSGIGTTVLELAKDKKINFAPPRKEEREVILQNTTPNWIPKIKL